MGTVATEKRDDAMNRRTPYRFIVEQTAQMDPAEAVLAEYGVPVWAIIGHLKAIDWDIQRTAADYDVSADAVHATVRYYEQQTTAIDARLRANLPPAPTRRASARREPGSRRAGVP